MKVSPMRIVGSLILVVAAAVLGLSGFILFMGAEEPLSASEVAARVDAESIPEATAKLATAAELSELRRKKLASAAQTAGPKNADAAGMWGLFLGGGWLLGLMAAVILFGSRCYRLFMFSCGLFVLVAAGALFHRHATVAHWVAAGASISGWGLGLAHFKRRRAVAAES